MTLFALQSLVGIVDFVFVGSLGTQAIAGVGVAVQIQFLTFGLLEAVITGTVALIAREMGAGRPQAASRVLRTALVLAAGLGALLMLAIPASESFVRWMGVEPAVVSLGGRCLAILLGFAIPVSVSGTLAMGLRAAGDVRTPLAIGVLANALNVVLCYALVFGRFGAPELGARGSVLAAGISFTLGAAALVALWWRGNLRVPRLVPGASVTWATSWRLLRIGLPTALEQAAFQGGLLVFLSIIALYGTPPVSRWW
jgi:putative MATE family efflux protein